MPIEILGASQAGVIAASGTATESAKSDAQLLLLTP